MAEINNPVGLTFCNETIRIFGDRLAGLMAVPDVILAAAIGKGIPEMMGTTSAKILQQTDWTADDWAAIPIMTITGSDSGNRTLLTNVDVIKMLLVAAKLSMLSKAYPWLPPLIGNVAVNPTKF
jgi:hypothetical protein